MTDNDLYRTLVAMCQQHGFTTDATYDALHDAVDSILADPDDEDDLSIV